MDREEGLKGEILRGEDRQVSSDHSRLASYVVGSRLSIGITWELDTCNF